MCASLHIRYTVSGANGILKWWVNGRIAGEATSTLISTPLVRFTNTFVGRSNWGHDATLNGNVYFFSAMNGALIPDQAVAKSNELLEILGRPPVASLGNNVRFVRVKAPTQGDAWLQIAQLQVGQNRPFSVASFESQRLLRCSAPNHDVSHSCVPLRFLTPVVTTLPFASQPPHHRATVAPPTQRLQLTAPTLLALTLPSFTGGSLPTTFGW